MSGRIATLFALVPFLTIASAGEAQTRIEKTFSDWLVTCQETEVTKTCLMSQTLTDSASKQMALVWVVNKGADGSTKAMVHTPLGVLLPEGLKI